jgi:hypothetical protein
MAHKRPVVVGSVFVVATLLALAVLLRYVPFELASYAAWAGIFASLAGLVCLARPIPSIGIGTRARAVVLLGSCALVTVLAVAWPAPVRVAGGPHRRLDDFLPAYQFTEYHEGIVEAPKEHVLEAVRRVSLADMPAAVFLMRLRALADGQLDGRAPDPQPILDMMDTPGSGFLVLDVSDPSELVYGMVGRPWVNELPPAIATPEQFLAFDEPGHIRVAFDIRVRDEGEGVFRISTETRTLGNDEGAQRLFARYWRLIYPGSAIIRQVWLDAIIARASRGGEGARSAVQRP